MHGEFKSHSSLARGWVHLAAILFAAFALSSCCSCPGTSDTGGRPTPTPEKAATPTMGTVSIPSGPGTWGTVGGPPYRILPVQGRGVRLHFYAPLGSTFAVKLVEPNGTVTQLPLSTGVPATGAGYYEIVNVNPGASPIWELYVRAPIGLATPNDYDISVQNLGGALRVAPSDEMVVDLAPAP